MTNRKKYCISFKHCGSDPIVVKKWIKVGVSCWTSGWLSGCFDWNQFHVEKSSDAMRFVCIELIFFWLPSSCSSSFACDASARGVKSKRINAGFVLLRVRFVYIYRVVLWNTVRYVMFELNSTHSARRRMHMFAFFHVRFV